MEFNSINVANGDCKDLGTPRSAEEAFATFNLRIPASTVRKLAKAGYTTVAEYTDFSETGVAKEGAENWEDLPEFDEPEIAAGNEEAQDDVADDTEEGAGDIETPDTETVDTGASAEEGAETATEGAAEGTEGTDADANAAGSENDTAPVDKASETTLDPVKAFLKEKKVQGYAFYNPKNALAKAKELGYQG